MVYMETNADKGLMLDKMMAHPLAKTWDIQPVPYRETQNKQIKIATVVKRCLVEVSLCTRNRTRLLIKGYGLE